MENKTLLIMKGLVVIVLIVLVGWLANISFRGGNDSIKVGKFDYKNTTYFIEGDVVTLVDGYSERDVAPGSASKSITRYFGNEVVADVNNDGFDDVAVILSQSNGGSGVFYYVSVAIGASDGLIGTNTIFLGDRIAPQSTGFRDGIVVVNYADRNPGESFDIKPSRGVSRYFKLIGYELKEVDQNGNLLASTTLTPGERCNAVSGNWNSLYGECLGVSESTCQNIGGKFNPCASACRHDPSAMICTMQCVLVCKVN